MPRLNLNLIWFSLIFSLLCYGESTRSVYGRYFVDAMETIHYRGLESMDRQGLFDAAVRGMANEHDRYSSFISRLDKKRYVSNLDQKFSGIGIIVEADDDGNGIYVVNTIIGNPHPAHDAGMRSGDRIIAVEGETVIGKPLTEAVEKIRGPTDTYVALTVRGEDGGTPRDLIVRRADIQVDSVLGDVRDADGAWDYSLAADPRIAYIRLSSFGDRTADELRTQLRKLEKAGNLGGLIIDVRDNAGGYLSAAHQVCDLFIREGTIVETRGRGGIVERRYVATDEGTFDGFPMAILINGESASASEILAACLQDYDRATIVGVRTFGKGSVQQMIPMEGDRSILKLTTASFWRPSDRNIHRLKSATDEDQWGVRPDKGFVVELTDEEESERIELRRARDAFRPDRTDVVEGSVPEIDRQLKAAVQLLHEKIDQQVATK